MSNILYHYTTGQGVLGILGGMEFHATNIKYMNDPQEVEYFDTLIEEIFSSDPTSEIIFKEILKLDGEASMLCQILPVCLKYIISLCRDDDSLPMWKYYAHGNGYNIGLDIDILKEKINEINGGGFKIEVFNIIYDRQEQIKILKKFINDNFYIWCSLYGNSREKDSKISKFIWELSMMRYKFKHEAYKDEKEVRVLLEWNEEQEFKINKEKNNPTIEKRFGYKVSDKGVIIEYLKVRIPDNCVKSIMCSPQAEKIHIQGIDDYISRGALNMHEKMIQFFSASHYIGIPQSHIKINKSKIPFRDI